MNIILIQAKLTLEEIDLLLREFPQYLFLSLSIEGCQELDQEHWSRVEAFFGSSLSKDEIDKAHQLKWIHTPTDDINSISYDHALKKEGILISYTHNPNIRQMAEYVFSGITAYAKHLFHWKDAFKFPNLIWEAKWKESIWTLENKTLLQIGLGRVGTEITSIAKRFDMRIYGVEKKRTFHPNCHKTIALQDLHSVLPVSDVVVITLPKDRIYYECFGKAELDLMKDDSILIVLGNSRAIDEEAVYDAALKGKLRGIMIDSYSETPISSNSYLWKLPHCLITPEVASMPELKHGEVFKSFRYNLRQYLNGNYSEMRNLITRTKKSITI